MFGDRFRSSTSCSRWLHETEPGRLDQSLSCRFLKVATHPPIPTACTNDIGMPHLWPGARRRLSLRTLFGREGIELGHPPDIVVIPAELRPRWRIHRIVEDMGGPQDSIGASWLCGGTAPSLERILRANWERLPGDLSILTRLERIATATLSLHDGTGRLADAFLIARTVEALDSDLELPPEDLALLVAHVSEMRGATIKDIRTASLVALTIAGDAVSSAERATSRWIRENLPKEADADTMWVLEHQAGNLHVAWWLRAIRDGLSHRSQCVESLIIKLEI